MTKIFIADDNETNRYNLDRILSNQGFKITAAKDGEELLNLFKKEIPDLIITDVSMPVKNGFDAVNELRENKSFSHIPIIFISAIHQDIASRIKGIDLGANDYIAVPYDEDELVSKITSMLKTKKLYDDLQCSENQLKKTVHEKEILLKEINHRVKNNFQLISSLLHLTQQTIKDDQAVSALNDSISRIQTMSLIHEKLYKSENISDINFASYIRTLLRHLINTYVVKKDQIKLITDIKNISLNIDKTIYCGLIVNELVTNSLKYAFPDNSKGEIKIVFNKLDGKYTLIVSDNGAGLPENFDIDSSLSFGLQIVTLLTKNLGGEIETGNKNGSLYKITFPE
jgi:two-component sensor histidine kinase